MFLQKDAAKRTKANLNSRVSVQKKSNGEHRHILVDNRSRSSAENTSVQKQSNVLVDNRPNTFVQLKPANESAANLSNPIQKKPNTTGLPDNLKSGIENLSGYSMDDVKVHYNSTKPAQLQAHAYAQGTDIHLGPGQEKHLPHEAWHVVQQKQGRVKPTMQMKGSVYVNDEAGLEIEADVMGAKAVQFKMSQHQVDELPAFQLKKMDGIDGLSVGEFPLKKKALSPTFQFYRSETGMQVHVLSGNTHQVTQFYPGEGLFSAIANFITHPALMLLIESMTTLTAAVIALKTNPVTGFALLGVAVAKYLRFCEVVQSYDQPLSEEQKAKVNKLRSLEAGLATLLALVNAWNPAMSKTSKIAAAIFSVLKLTRSALSFGSWGVAGKIFLHIIQTLEGIAVIVGGNNTDSPEPTEFASGVAGTVGGAKIVRGVRGIVDEVLASRASAPVQIINEP